MAKCDKFIRIELGPDAPSEREESIIADSILDKAKIVILVGAGISTSAGIPDFRSKGGLFAQQGREVVTHKSHYTTSDLTAFHDWFREMHEACETAQPTKFHQFMVCLARTGTLLRVYTSNIDNLEARNPELAEKTIQLHGSINQTECNVCYKAGEVVRELFSGGQRPTCQQCVSWGTARGSSSKYNLRKSTRTGVLRPRFTLYHDERTYNDRDIAGVVGRDVDLAPDLFVVAGTSMSTDVPGTRQLFRLIQRSGCPVVWINTRDPPSQLADKFNLMIIGKTDDFATLLIKTYQERGEKRIHDWQIVQDKNGEESVFLDVKSHNEHGKIVTERISEEHFQRKQPGILYAFWTAQGGRSLAIKERTGRKVTHWRMFDLHNDRNAEGGAKEYQVQWVGHPATVDDMSWEPMSKVRRHAPGLLKAGSHLRERVILV